MVITWFGLLFDPFVPEWAGFVNANMKARNNSNIVLKIKKWVNYRGRARNPDAALKSRVRSASYTLGRNVGADRGSR